MNALVRRSACLLIPVLLAGCGCFGDIGCTYYPITTERIRAACIDHGRVRSVVWDHGTTGATVICRDGEVVSMYADYAKEPIKP